MLQIIVNTTLTLFQFKNTFPGWLKFQICRSSFVLQWRFLSALVGWRRRILVALHWPPSARSANPETSLLCRPRHSSFIRGESFHIEFRSCSGPQTYKTETWNFVALSPFCLLAKQWSEKGGKWIKEKRKVALTFAEKGGISLLSFLPCLASNQLRSFASLLYVSGVRTF